MTHHTSFSPASIQMLLFSLILSATATLSLVTSLAVHAEETKTDKTKYRASTQVTGEFDGTLTLYRNGAPVDVMVMVRKVTLGGRLKGFSERTRHDGPILLPLRAGQVELAAEGGERELEEGQYQLIPIGQRLVVSTDDDTAIIQYVSVAKP